MSEHMATNNTTDVHDARMERFRTDIEDLKLRGGSGEGEKRLLALGVVVTVVGVALAIFGAVQVGNSGFADSTADNQRAYLAQGSLLGMALLIVGVGLFIRYSLARYLRFWLIRMTYESRANTDRIVDAIERGAGIERTVAPPNVVVGGDAAGPPPMPPTVPPATPQAPAAPPAPPH